MAPAASQTKASSPARPDAASAGLPAAVAGASPELARRQRMRIPAIYVANASIPATLDALAPARDAFAGAARISRRHPDLLFAVGLTVAAALPRLWSLGDVPQGVHGDEAQFAMDAQRLLDSGWIGVYTPSALGQPAGIAYVSAIGQWLFGATALGARLGVALVSIAAVPLAYLLFRLLADRTVAVIAALLLAVSLWHIHLGRVAAPTALVPTSELATLTLWTIGLRRGDWYWFLLAGVSLGLGLYTYTVYPSFVVAFALWILIYTVVWKRGPGFWPWAHNVAIAALAAFVTALPLFAYIADPDNDYLSHYRNYYDLYSVPASDAYAQADFGGRVDLIVDQAGRFLGAYAWHGTTDFVDGAAPDGLVAPGDHVPAGQSALERRPGQAGRLHGH